VTAAFIGRLPLPMLTLGSIVLVHSRTGSYAVAGAVTAAMVAAFAATAPVAGRLSDRAGQARVLAVRLAGLVAAAPAGAAVDALFAAPRRTEPALSPSGRRGGPRAIATPGLRVSAGVFVMTGGDLRHPRGGDGRLRHRAACPRSGRTAARTVGGSLLAGLWYGARDWHAPAQRRFAPPSPPSPSAHSCYRQLQRSRRWPPPPWPWGSRSPRR
jgi:MFS family permease